jgi:hypothetical protein
VFLIFWKNETISMFLEIFEMVMEFKFVRFQYFLRKNLSRQLFHMSLSLLVLGDEKL